MRRAAIHTQTPSAVALPRGWIIVGAALASWLVVAAVWTGMSQIFWLVASAV